MDRTTPSPWRPTRREFIGTVALAVLGVACSGGSPSPPPTTAAPQPSGPFDDLAKGAKQLSVLSTGSPVEPGTVPFSFALSDAKGGLVTGGTVNVWSVPADGGSKPLGPFQATWYPFTAYSITGDRSPKTPLPGTYVADIQVASAGNWLVGAEAAGGFGTAALPVSPRIPNAVGSKATSVKTPVATTDAAIAEICTRTPVDHLHAVSLDAALANGKPTVVSFATPLLCSSQLCGPVVDEQILASRSAGSKANFIHVEEFLPGPKHSPPPPSLENQSAGFKAWHLETEPWVFVVDRDGVIMASFEGPVTATLIEQALRPLL
jgi:hypothetical protein